MPRSLKPVESLSEFVQIASEVRERWLPGEDILPWFRGQERAEWGLVPKFYRGEPADNWIEDEMREEFAVRAPGLSEIRPSNDWEWYFVMQHHGAATRLLDWTEGSLLALYFAVRANVGDSDAAVWALDPWWLNRLVIGIDEVIPAGRHGVMPKDQRRIANWLYPVFAERRLPRLPVAIYAEHITRRVSAQRSCFTVHGSDLNGFGRIAARRSGGHLTKIVIAAGAIDKIRRDLLTSGIDESTVFPDLDALSRAVVNKWKGSSAKK